MSHFVRLFQPQFAAAVESGRKKQTVRPRPRRMPKPGDWIDCRMWTGKPYRSKQRRLREAVITSVETVSILAESTCRLPHLKIGGLWKDIDFANRFARQDGFNNWREMRNWFARTHGLPFSGILIKWL